MKKGAAIQRLPDPPPDAPSILTWALKNPQISAEKLEHLMKLEREAKADVAKVIFAREMKAAQEEIQPVARDAENPHTKSRYARLETIDAMIRPVYTKHGFSLSFNNPENEAQSKIKVICTVRHEAGHEEFYELSAAPDTTGAKGGATKTEVQGMGSTISYLRRYLTCMIFNIVLRNEDNDGNRMTGFLTEEQAGKIIDAIARAKLTSERETKFLDAMKVKAVSEIPQRDYARAMALLEQARRMGIPPLDLAEFPDPFDFQAGVRIRVAGSVYERAPDGSAWRPVARKGEP